ncbi:MAG: HDOD domain-containing protein [Planctomycetes bacterium]|nr:HDOD domain-containing protein [Planctomycetota bacterium]
MQIEDIANRVHGSRELPAFSSTGQKLLKMIADPNSTMQRIAAVVAMDPPLAASIMRLANSAAYGFSERTHDLGMAITRLGLRMLKTLVVSSSILRNVDNMGKLASLDRKGYWRFCLAAAIASRLVANRDKPLLGDDAFLIGLLHGLGVTVLDVFFPEVLHNALDRVGLESLPLRDAIQKSTGIGLGRIGAVLLREWQLDDTLVEALAATDSETRDMTADVAQRVHYVRVGISLARAAGIGKPIDIKPPESCPNIAAWAEAARRLGESMEAARVAPENLEELVEQVKRDFGFFLGLAGEKAA